MVILGLVLVVALGAGEARAQVCLGDCDGDGRVAVNELVVGVNINLGSAGIGSCPAFDDGSGVVSVSSLVRAVNHSLDGCPAVPTPTPTSTPSGPTPGVDLAPSSAETNVPPPPLGCLQPGEGIADPVTTICVANLGPQAAAAFDVATSGNAGDDEFRVASIEGLSSECFDRPFVGADVTVTVDANDEIEESDETNNTESYNAPPPTLTPPPSCTPTSTATQTETPEATSTASATGTATGTVAATLTPTVADGTATATATDAGGATSTPTGTATGSVAATLTPTVPPASPTATATDTGGATSTPTGTATGTSAATLTPTVPGGTPTATATATDTGGQTATATATDTGGATSTPTGTATGTSAATLTPTVPGGTPTATATATDTGGQTATATATDTGAATSTPTGTATGTSAATLTPTVPGGTPTASATATDTGGVVSTPTATPMATGTGGASSTPTPTGTGTPQGETATPTATLSPADMLAEVESLVADVLSDLFLLHLGSPVGVNAVLSGVSQPLPCGDGGTQTFVCQDIGGSASMDYAFDACASTFGGDLVTVNGDLVLDSEGSCLADPLPVGEDAVMRFQGSLAKTNAQAESFSAEEDVEYTFSVDADGTVRFVLAGTIAASCVGGLVDVETADELVVGELASCPTGGRVVLTVGGETHVVSYTMTGGVEIDLGNDGSVEAVFASCADAEIEKCFSQ